MHWSKKRPRVAEEGSGAPSTAEDDDAGEVIRIHDSIHFAGEVSTKNVLAMLRCLNEANEIALRAVSRAEDARVYLYINSYGGDAFAGLSAMDHIRCNKVAVVTIGDGYVASAATFLLLGGSERKGMANFRLLIHQVSTAFWGKFGELLDEVENSKELMDSLRDVYMRHTNLKKKEVKLLLTKELHMNATRALECGFVDELW